MNIFVLNWCSTCTFLPTRSHASDLCILLSFLDTIQLHNIWLGQAYTKPPELGDHKISFQRSIRPTRTLYYGGLNEAGACRLPDGWNGCTGSNDLCDATLPEEASRDELGMMRNSVQYFDEHVTIADADIIKPVTEGALSRLHYRMQHVGTSHVKSLMLGDYAGRYFSDVYEALETRGLVMPFELPEKIPRPFLRLASVYMRYPMFTQKIDRVLLAARNSSDGSDVWLDPPGLNTIASKISLKDILPHSSLFQVTFNGTSTGEEQNEPKRIPTSLENVTLPAFASDHSEMFLASMIERQADSWDLHLTTFLLSHFVMVYDRDAMNVQDLYRDRDAIIDWAKASLAFRNATFLKNGARTPNPRHFCKITTKAGDEAYTVEGTMQNNDKYISQHFIMMSNQTFVHHTQVRFYRIAKCLFPAPTQITK